MFWQVEGFSSKYCYPPGYKWALGPFSCNMIVLFFWIPAPQIKTWLTRLVGNIPEVSVCGEDYLHLHGSYFVPGG